MNNYQPTFQRCGNTMLYKSVYCYQALNHSTCHYISSPVIFLQSLGRTICKLPMYVLWYVYYYTSRILCSYSRSVKAHFQTSLCPRISSCYLHHNDRGKLSTKFCRLYKVFSSANWRGYFPGDVPKISIRHHRRFPQSVQRNPAILPHISPQ